MRIRAICIAAALSCLFLWPCASLKAAQPATSPFALTGMLARPDESAEEILLRAHQRDAGATRLAAIGYLQGIGGFPKSPLLASAWAYQLTYYNDTESAHLFALMHEAYGLKLLGRNNIGKGLAICKHALSGEMAPLFKEAGIFDARQYCAGLDLENRKNTEPDWEKRYKAVLDENEEIEKRFRSTIATVRAFRDQPCSWLLLENMRFTNNRLEPTELLPFYAATTHDPAKETPDWSAERLLLFIDKLHSCSQGESKDFKKLMDYSKEALINDLILDRERALSVIHSAHDIRNPDYTKAARAMAAHYRDGSLGFLKNDRLARLWLQQAAFDSDAQSKLLLAADYFAREKYVQAWVWADITIQDKDVDGKAKKLAVQLMELAEPQAGKNIRETGTRFRAVYDRAIRIWVDWCKAQRQYKEEEE